MINIEAQKFISQAINEKIIWPPKNEGCLELKKRAIFWIELFSKEEINDIKEDLYLLYQDPSETSKLGSIAKSNYPITHVIEGLPVLGKKIKYTGKVFLGGTLYNENSCFNTVAYLKFLQLFFSKQEINNIKYGLYLLQQDPLEKNIFGVAAKMRWEIVNIVDGLPNKWKKTKYTGKVFFQGDLYDRKAAYSLVAEYVHEMPQPPLSG